MIRQFELVEMVRAYNPDSDEALLNRAYVFGVKAHGGQVRASGEPYFNHPVEVAAILTKLRLDDATIVTALLHDTIEDTEVSHAEIAEKFGDEIAQLVHGVTKLSKIKLRGFEEAQAENLRKLLVAMAEDPRVLLVKMADRLHNMRTIQHLRPEKRERIARETLEIYGPLAGRMGMQSVRDELEDISFSVLQPEARLSVMRRFIHLKHVQGLSAVPSVVDGLKGILEEAGVEAEVTGREKRPYAIWRKMERKDVAFGQLSDIIAFRVLVADEADCYRALGAIHSRWRAVLGRFKDYISWPKTNGYRSLHTTVIGPERAQLEVQIRTREMHEVAETGVAAHWAYKDGARSRNPFAVDPFRWLRKLVDRVESGDQVDGSAADFLEDAKREISFDRVFCFTPKGEVIDLPLGSTALDFAYAVHTDLGHRAVGAKIDGRRAPVWTALRTGQTVEILRSEAQKPLPIWEEMVKTGRARSAIRRTVRAQAQADAAALGAKILERVFERAELAYSRRAVETAAEHMTGGDAEALLAQVGDGRMTARSVLQAVYPENAALKATEPTEMSATADRGRPQVLVARHGGGHAVGESLALPAALCCRPLPGERVVALREPEGGYRLHAIDCATLEAYEDSMDLWLDVRWAPEADDAADHLATVSIVLANEPGALGQVCTLIGAAGANIDDLLFVDRKPDYFKVAFDIEVRDLRHFNNILRTLHAQPVVADAERLRPARRGSAEAMRGGDGAADRSVRHAERPDAAAV